MLQCQIVSDDPKLDLVHSGLGDLLLYRNQPEQARKHYRLSQGASERYISDRNQRDHANEYDRIGTTYTRSATEFVCSRTSPRRWSIAQNNRYMTL